MIGSGFYPRGQSPCAAARVQRFRVTMKPTQPNLRDDKYDWVSKSVKNNVAMFIALDADMVVGTDIKYVKLLKKTYRNSCV